MALKRQAASLVLRRLAPTTRCTSNYGGPSLDGVTDQSAFIDQGLTAMSMLLTNPATQSRSCSTSANGASCLHSSNLKNHGK